MKLFTSIFLSLLLPLAVAAQAPVVSYDSLVTPWSRTIVGLDERDSITTLDYFVLDSLDNWLHKGHCSVFRDSLHRMDSISKYEIVQRVAYYYCIETNTGEKIYCLEDSLSNYIKKYTSYEQQGDSIIKKANYKRGKDIDSIWFDTVKVAKNVKNIRKEIPISYKDSVVYDSIGNIIEKYNFNRTWKIVYHYNKNGLLHQEEYFWRRTKDENWKKSDDNSITFIYFRGRLIKDKTSNDSRYTRYLYHSNGQLAKEKKYEWDSRSEQFELYEIRNYSCEGKLITIYGIKDLRRPVAPFSKAENKEPYLKALFEYDSNGNIINEEHFAPSCTGCVKKKVYQYDSLNNIISQFSYLREELRHFHCLGNECCYTGDHTIDTALYYSPKRTIYGRFCKIENRFTNHNLETIYINNYRIFTYPFIYFEKKNCYIWYERNTTRLVEIL